jgi:putative ABC transport system permease protein
VFGLLTVAVAAMVMGTAVATAAPGQPGEATFGTATTMITLPGSDPSLAADITTIRHRYGTVDVIDNENLSTGTTQDVQLRGEDPHAAFGSPMLALVSGRYPAAPGQVALTGAVADLYGVSRGGAVRLAGRSWRVTGIVQNPGNLLDEFALVKPGQVSDPTRVSILLDAPRGGIRGLPFAAVVSYPATGGSGISPAVIALAASVLGLVFVGLVAVAGFTVMAQRRLRALGMLSSLGATSRNVQLVMVANGAAVGAAAVVAGSVAGSTAAGKTTTIRMLLGLVRPASGSGTILGGSLTEPATHLGIAAAMLAGPKLLILDEPTNGLDPAGIVEMRGLIRSLAGDGITVLVSSHLISKSSRYATTRS